MISMKWLYMWYHIWYHIFYDIIYINYDIIYDIMIYMISYMISWYLWNDYIYDIIYDIIYYMISYIKQWYHIWYHDPALADTVTVSDDCEFVWVSLFLFVNKCEFCIYDIIYDIIIYVWYHIHILISYIIYDIIVYLYMIYAMISYMISVRSQLPILPRHSALMIVMLTWTDQRMPTRCVTMLTKTPPQTWTWRKMPRFLRHFWSTCPLAWTPMTLSSCCKTFPFSRQWLFQSGQCRRL